MDVDVAVEVRAGRWTTQAAESPKSAPSQRVSSTRAKSRPESSAVLSSIIDSLDTLSPLPDIQTSDHFSDTASRRSLPESITNRSVASSPSIHKLTVSPGFGVEYGGQLELDDVDGTTDAALPPTVPTSRPPSGLSHYTSSLRPQPPSRKSSLNSIRSAGSPRKALSSESWVRRSLSKGEEDDLSSVRGRLARKSRMHGMASRPSLREDENWSPRGASEDSARLSLAEQTTAKAPAPPLVGRGRIYLTDATINEDQAETTAPPLVTSDSFGARSGDSGSKASERLSVSGKSLKSPSPILDSIPMRTSSVGISTSARKKKSKKLKRSSTISAPDKTSYRPSSPIPESSWADLGEDDETVKRIRQLREQRKSRLQEEMEPLDILRDSLPATPSPPPIPERSEARRSPSMDNARKPRKLQRPILRHNTDDLKAYRSTSLRNDAKPTRALEDVPAAGANPLLLHVAASQRPAYSLDLQRSVSQPRPQTAKSGHRLSLDYSYARAMNLFQEGSPEPSAESERRSRDSSAPAPTIRYLGTDTPAKPGLASSPSHSGTGKKSKRKLEVRVTGEHPDLPLTFDTKKNRRKSMSDARAIVAAEKEAASRRDSIDEAIAEYLQAPRLNRKVKHLPSGRNIAYSELGDPKGAAVIICVGMGLTRYVSAFYDELATTLRLRLITIDRPGVGGSDPYPPADKSGPLNWPEDVLAICQHLGIIKFSILAHSAGAIYALATALILPHLVRGKVHLLAPWVPPSQLEAISHPTASAPPANPLPRAQRLLRVLPTPFLKAANSSFMTATSASLKPASKRSAKSTVNKASPRREANGDKIARERSPGHERPEYRGRESMMLMDQYMPSMNPLDNYPLALNQGGGIEDERNGGPLGLTATATPMDPSFAYASIGLYAAEHAERERQVEYTSRLTQATWDMATRDSNPATDLLVCLERNRDVGFRYTDVAREVIITHGSEDKRVPVANVKWLAEQMNRRALGVGLANGNERADSRDSYVSTSRGGCEVRILQGEGHGLMASPSIMGDILEEIAKTAYERESLHLERRD